MVHKIYNYYLFHIITIPNYQYKLKSEIDSELYNVVDLNDVIVIIHKYSWINTYVNKQNVALIAVIEINHWNGNVARANITYNRSSWCIRIYQFNGAMKYLILSLICYSVQIYQIVLLFALFESI